MPGLGWGGGGGGGGKVGGEGVLCKILIGPGQLWWDEREKVCAAELVAASARDRDR